MTYNERFTEMHVPLAVINNASYNSQQVTPWVSLGNYHRAVAILKFGAIGAVEINAHLEQALGTQGYGQKLIAGKAITTLLNADDNALIAIELRTEELDVTNHYESICLKVTPSGAVIFTAFIFGIQPRYAPGPVTGWHEVVP